MRSGKSGLGIRVAMAAMVALALVAAACTAEQPGPWRGKDCSGTPKIAAGASLFGCDLTGRDLSGADLSGADLRGAVLVGANLSNANLAGANLEGANLSGANLTGANLTGAILAGAILLGALFVGATLSGVSFDFGRSFGRTGTGGGGPSGSSCVGDYCPGYNQATVDNGHPLCDANVGNLGFGSWFYVHRTQQMLASSGSRSVVLDGATSFEGATFDYSQTGLPSIITLRGLDWSKANFADATFINAGFGCQQGDGARFSGATFISTGDGGDATHWYAVDLTNSDFSNTTWTGVVMSTVDFTGSSFAGATISNWRMENQLDFDNDGQPDDGYVSPHYLMRLDATDFTGARIGLDVNPGTGSDLVELAGEFNGTPFTSVSFANANLTDAEIKNVRLMGADLSGVIAAGATIHGPAWFNGADLTGGWSGANWVDGAEWYGFSGATCPDGSAYDDQAPCLP